MARSLLQEALEAGSGESSLPRHDTVLADRLNLSPRPHPTHPGPGAARGNVLASAPLREKTRTVTGAAGLSPATSVNVAGRRRSRGPSSTSLKYCVLPPGSTSIPSLLMSFGTSRSVVNECRDVASQDSSGDARGGSGHPLTLLLL
jgi:hypothetical protein